jgi:formiminoglutamase
MFEFQDRDALRALVNVRPGEKKLGSSLPVLQEWKQLDQLNGRFVLLGVEEDIGIKANRGRTGAREAWPRVLAALANVQDNAFLQPEELIIAGSLRFTDWQEEADRLDPNIPAQLERLRALTAQIDGEVAPLIRRIKAQGKIPIVIGGGHNNAYGLIRGCSEQLGEGLSVLNIDPHADFRADKGRHSGNGFRHAFQEGWLARYVVFGLEEGANNEEMIRQFHRQPQLYYLSYDELLTFSTQERDKLFKDALHWLGSSSIGLELDCDALDRFPASAYNVSGFPLRQARLLVKTAAALRPPHYFHLPEAAPALAPDEVSADAAGKVLALLVTDFIKAYGKA